jgi:hypothetical protein
VRATVSRGEASIGQLVFGTPVENFCKWLYRKKLAAKKGKIENEQKCAGFEQVLNKSARVLRRNERILCVFLTDAKCCQPASKSGWGSRKIFLLSLIFCIDKG